MTASWAFGLVMARLPRLLLGAWSDMQLPLLHGCLLRRALSLLSMSELGALVGWLKSSLAGFELSAIDNGEFGR